MASSANRHFKWLFGIGGCALVITAATNLMVNPWRVLPQATEIAALDPYREIDAEIRTCKAGLASRGPWDTIIIGSSRPNTGIDPTSPAFDHRQAVNLGMPGSDIFETSAMVTHALKTQKPKQALLFLDAGDLTRPGKIKIDSDFEISPLSSTADPVERSLRYVFSQMAMDASVVALRNAALKKAPAYTPRGLHLKKPPRLDYFLAIEKFYLPWTLQLVDAQKLDLGIQQEKMNLTLGMLEECAAAGVQPVLIIPPNHLTLCQAMEESGSPDPYFLAERRALVGLVAAFNAKHPEHPCRFWDLNIPSSITLEAFPPGRDRPMDYWLDPIHFTPAAGERYANLILASRNEDPSLAIDVDPTQPDAYLARVKELFLAAESALPTERAGIRKAVAARPASQAHQPDL